MINGDKFNISEETFKSLDGKSGLVYIREFNGIINLTSIASILPLELSENSGNRRKYGGGYAIRKGSAWIDEYSGANIDLNYYPELRENYEQPKPNIGTVQGTKFLDSEGFRKLAN